MSDIVISQVELATIKDSLQCLELMFEDMVKHDIKTKARSMAGRILHSDGYDKVVESVDRKYRIHVKKQDG